MGRTCEGDFGRGRGREVELFERYAANPRVAYLGRDRAGDLAEVLEQLFEAHDNTTPAFVY
jgi:hypothetical protein